MHAAPRLTATRRLAVAICAALAGAVVTATPASADQFEPQNTAPAISSPSLELKGGQVMTAFRPDSGESDDIYEYTATISDAESLNDVSRADLCLYHSQNETGGAGEGDPACANIDPANTVRLRWTRSTNVFSISAGTSAYWRLGAGSTSSAPQPPSPLTATAGSIIFRFKVSEVMREGVWTAKLTVTDNNGLTATDSSWSKPVNAYSSITVRSQQSFGTLASGVASTRTAAPSVTSNGATTVSLTAGNFTNGAFTFGLKTDGGASAGPGAGQVAFDCITGGTFTAASAIRIGATATSLGAGSGTSTGTMEGGAAINNTCRLIHGGNRPVAAYSFTVVNAVSNI